MDNDQNEMIQKLEALSLKMRNTLKPKEDFFKEENLCNWLIGGSIATLLWWINSFDKFLVDDVLHLKWLFFLVIAAFLAGLLFLSFWRLYLIASDLMDVLFVQTFDKLVKKVKSFEHKESIQKTSKELDRFSSFKEQLWALRPHTKASIKFGTGFFALGILLVGIYFIAFILIFK